MEQYTFSDDSKSESHRKETASSSGQSVLGDSAIDHKQVQLQVVDADPSECGSTGKRPAEEPPESGVDTKKPKPDPVLEDDLSEISDDADDILNRDEVLQSIFFYIFFKSKF